MQRKGFTLLEVLTVIFIFGILVSISGYVYSSALARSRDNQRKSDLQTIKNSLEQFYLDNKAYPGFETNSNNVAAAKWQLEKGTTYGSGNCPQDTSKKFLTPGYIGSVPEDPQKKLQFSGTCGFSPTSEYLYYALPKLPSTAFTPREGYYLLAKMERDNNFSDPILLSTVSNRLDAIERYSSLPAIGANLAYYNHVVSSSRNN